MTKALHQPCQEGDEEARGRRIWEQNPQQTCEAWKAQVI